MEKNVEIHETFTCKIFLKQNLCKKIIKFPKIKGKTWKSWTIKCHIKTCNFPHLTVVGESGEVNEYEYPKSPFPVNKTIDFQQPFAAKPSIMYGITMLDMNYAENKRAKIKLLRSDPASFTVWLGTMHDTKLYGLGMRWMACD